MGHLIHGAVRRRRGAARRSRRAAPMSRRMPQEAGFGSDSFLDVLANMVGILIILIVIAGVKLGRPVEETLADDPPAPAAQESAEPEEPPVAVAAAEPPAAEPEPVPELEPDEAPAEVAGELASIARELQTMRRDEAASD